MPFKPGGLGAHLPEEKPYADKYPLAAIGAAAVSGTPIALATNWYSRFDNPTKDSAGRYWAAKPGENLGSIRGRHCYCVKPRNRTDSIGWWEFYDQGSEGACVGFGWSRVMSLFNRQRYDGFWLYHRAQQVDSWPGEAYEGTSTDAGAKVLKDEGHRVWTSTGDKPVNATRGISAYRWTFDPDEALRVIDMPLAYSLEALPFLNSWGRYYSHITWMPVSVVQRLMNEDGEMCVPTDR